MAFDFRWGMNQSDKLPQLAAELVRAKVDVIVTAGTPAALAAKRVTPTIPIVLVLAGDPVRTGLAAALDAAHVYPVTWQLWEETFDPLGQVLEHYWFLQQFASQCAATGSAALLYFEAIAEGQI